MNQFTADYWGTTGLFHQFCLVSVFFVCLFIFFVLLAYIQSSVYAVKQNTLAQLNGLNKK